MADDIKVKLGIDVGNLFANLDKVVSKLAEVAKSADKAETEIGQIDDHKIDIDTAPAKQSLDTLSKDAEGFGSKLKESFSGANLGAGLVGGLAGGLASAGIGTAVQGVQALGKAIFDGAVRADDFGDKLEVAFKQQGVKDIEGEIEKVRESSLGLANDLGMPVERTRELAGTVAQLGGVTGKQAEDLTKLSAGIETFTDGTVKGEAVAKAFSRGLADPEGAAAIEALSKKYPQLAETLKSNLDPAQKLAAANKILGTSFETVKAQQGDAGGTLNQFSNGVTVAFEKIGSVLYDIANIVIPIFSSGFNEIKTIFADVFGASTTGPAIDFKQLLIDVSTVIKDVLVASLDGLSYIIKTVWDIAVYAFEEIQKAIQPLVESIGGGGSNSLKGVLEFVTDIVKSFWDITKALAKTIIDVLVYGINLLAQALGAIINAGREVYEFFTNLNAVSAGLSAAMSSVATTIKNLFDAVINLNWGQIGSIISGAFGAADDAYKKAYERTKALKDANKELNLSALNALAGQKQLANSTDNTLKPPPPPPKPPKGGAPKVETELDKTLEAYNAFSDKLATQREADVQAEKKRLNLSVDETSAYRQKKLLEDTKLSQEKLNELFAGVKTESFQTDLKIKANFKEGEIQTDVIKKYQDIFTKNQATLEKSSEVKIKINIPAFKDELKEVDNAIKEYTTTADKLVPINFTTDSAEIAKVQQDVLNFQEFLKSENDRIRLLQQEAQIAGNEEAAQKFSEAINKNIQSINTLDNRVKTFAEKSKEEQKKNTLEYQIQTALQTSFLDVFNSEKIRKEKETNDAIRKERLDSLDAEENDLNKSLAKREISAEEYAAKLADINNGRQKAQEETEVTVLERLKQAGDKVVGDVLKTQGAAFTEQAKKMEGGSKIMYEAMGGLATSFGALAASGKATLKDFAGASIDIAVQAMMKMIPIWTAEIFATSVAELGVGGLAVAAGLQIVLMGLVSAARSAGGFKDGVVGLHGEGTETSDSIPAWLSRGESVITARATRNNREELEFMNRTGLSIAEFYKMKMPSTSVSITPEGDLIREVRKLREETRGLGVRIQRNTSVEVSGVLTADSKSINALIVEQKRRSARRG